MLQRTRPPARSHAPSALEKGADLDDLLAIKSREAIGRCKYIPERQTSRFEEIERQMAEEINALVSL